MELVPIINELIEKYGKRTLCEKLNLSCGTIDRWIEMMMEDCKNEMMEKVMGIKWCEIAFLSTNSAYNLRSSQIYSVLL